MNRIYVEKIYPDGRKEVVMEETTTTKVITHTGNSLIIKVTDECRLLGIDVGDIVELTIRVKERMGMEQGRR